MNKLAGVFICVLLFFKLGLNAQTISAETVLKNSIKYHDPKGKLLNESVEMFFTETRPEGDSRYSSIGFNIKDESFYMTRKVDEGELKSQLTKGKALFTLAESTEITEELLGKYKLNEKRLKVMKNYYQYLWLLPMKLSDPGTIVDPKVKKIDFFGKESLQVKVNYLAEVGNDTWYFYFHPKTYSLQGYRFYHDESKNDGEYIILEDEVRYKSVRLAQKRTWYTHKEDKLLGTDILNNLKW